MGTFIERLQEEERELSEKVGDVQWYLLAAQLNAMKSYLHIIQDRITDLIQKQ